MGGRVITNFEAHLVEFANLLPRDTPSSAHSAGGDVKRRAEAVFLMDRSHDGSVADIAIVEGQDDELVRDRLQFLRVLSAKRGGEKQRGGNSGCFIHVGLFLLATQRGEVAHEVDEFVLPQRGCQAGRHEGNRALGCALDFGLGYGD